MAEKEKIFTKGNIITMVVCIAASLLISLVLFFVSNTNLLINNNSFKVDSFTLNSETTDFAYSDNYTTYEGKGVVTCWDKSKSYYVLIEVTDEANNSSDYITCLVSDGEGSITTYDTTASKKINKPDYKFKVVGFIPFEK